MFIPIFNRLGQVIQELNCATLVCTLIITHTHTHTQNSDNINQAFLIRVTLVADQ